MATASRRPRQVPQNNVWQNLEKNPPYQAHEVSYADLYSEPKWFGIPKQVAVIGLITATLAVIAAATVIFIVAGGSSSPSSSLGLGQKTWTVKLGTVQKSEDYDNLLRQKRVRGSPDLVNVDIAPKPTTVTVVVITPKGLGLKHKPTTEELFEDAQKQGYRLCPAEVGPALRLQYFDQPTGEEHALVIGMKPILNAEGTYFTRRAGMKYNGPGDRVFALIHGAEGLWLTLEQCPLYWSLDTRFVFVKP